jgi:hypothetical protein
MQQKNHLPILQAIFDPFRQNTKLKFDEGVVSYLQQLCCLSYDIFIALHQTGG